MSFADEGYFRNALCALSSISTHLFEWKCNFPCLLLPPFIQYTFPQSAITSLQSIYIYILNEGRQQQIGQMTFPLKQKGRYINV